MKKIFILLLLSMSSNLFAEPKGIKPNLTLSTGTVERFENFNSKYISARNVDVWLPDNYNPKNKYSVLYMHDGQMLFDASTTWNKQEWGVDEVIGKLIAEGAIKPCIVVGIWNSGINRHSDYFPQKPFEQLSKEKQDSLISRGKRYKDISLFANGIQSDNYLKFIVYELKPFIDKTYSTKKKAKDTFMAGSSMGGLISMYAICEYPKVFGGAACLSTHWIGSHPTENNPMPEQFCIYLKNNLPNPKNHKLYFDYGTKTLDAQYEPFQKKVDAIMEEKKFKKNWTTIKFNGLDHSEKSWNKRLHIPILFLLGK